MSSQNQSAFIEEHISRRFTIQKKVGSGAYGHVWKVQQKSTKKIFALKKIFDAFQHATDAQRTYRQIEILRQLDHPNIIKLFETIKAQNNRDVYLIFEFVEADLHNVIAQNILKDVHIRYIIYHIAKSLKYLHSGKIIHRDLKPSNVLVNANCSIKICDFGLVRSLAKGKSQAPVLTEGVATRWYRAPQVLLGSKSYSTPADIWSFGCIIYEILAQKPLFNGSCTLDQIEKVCSFTGYPSEDDIQSLQSEVARSLIKEMKISTNTKPNAVLKDLGAPYIDLLQRMMVFNPKKRITIEQILAHELVKPFRKIQDEPVLTKQISTSIDDNKKFSVDEYRRLVYGTKPGQKPKGLSSSLGAGSVSPKYSNLPNKSVNFGQNRVHDLTKKHSFDALKGNQGSYLEETSKKWMERQNIRYIRSLNNLTKGQHGFLQSPTYKKEPVHQDIPNKEETDPVLGESGVCGQLKVSQTTSSSQAPKYSMYHQKYTPFGSSHSTQASINSNINTGCTSPTSPTSPSWKQRTGAITQTTILTPSQIKDKVLQFRSPKNINTVGTSSGFISKTGVTIGKDIGTKKGL